MGRPYSPARCLRISCSWTLNVLFQRLIHENAVRIAACVAFLACSLLGKPLHELQHLVGAGHCGHHEHSDVAQGKSKRNDCGQPCRGRSHPAVLPAPERDSESQHGTGHGIPEHSHDSHDCSVCQVLCVSATSTDNCAVSLRPNACKIRDAFKSETLEASAPQSADARGPPRLA
jgi:hypothetical protein